MKSLSTTAVLTVLSIPSSKVISLFLSKSKKPPSSRFRRCVAATSSPLSQEYGDVIFPRRRRRYDKKHLRRNKKTFVKRFSFLETFESSQDINTWMCSLATADPQDANPREKGNLTVPFLQPKLNCWSSRDEVDFIRLLRERGAYKAIETFFVEHHSRHRNVYVYTTAIASLAASKDFRNSSFSLFKDMEGQGIPPTPHTYTALFRAASGARQVQVLSDRLGRDYPNIPWTVAVYDAALHACIRCDDCYGTEGEDPSYLWLTASRLFEQMRSQGLSPSTQTYLALFQACAISHRVSTALSLLEGLITASRLDASFSGAPRLLTPRLWDAALQVCVADGDHHTALRMIQMMVNAGQSPNAVHYTTYLKTLVAADQVQIALQVLRFMRTSRDQNTPSPTNSSAKNNNTITRELSSLGAAPPHIVAVKTVLAACARTESFVEAKNILNDMKEGSFGEQVQADEQCYNLVLAACQDPEEAKALIREMRLSRRHRVGAVPPSPITYTRAITVCRKACDVESALFLLDIAQNHDGMTPDVYMYSATIWTAAAAGDCERALQILEQMIANKCQPNIVSYNGVIAALASCERVDDAVKVLCEEIQGEGLTPTSTTFVHLARVIRGVKNPKERLDFLARIYPTMGKSERLVRVGGPVLESLIQTFGALGRYRDARRVFDSIEGPSGAPCIRAMLFACSTASPTPKWQEALSLLHSSDIAGETRGPAYMDKAALCNAMLACSKADQWEESLELLRSFGADKDNVSIVALNSLIAACGRGGRADMALEILYHMESQYGVTPDVLSYRNAIIACNQAEHVKHHQKRLSASQDRKNFVSSLSTPCFAWWECAIALLRRMKESGLQPDTQTYSSAISACEAAGQWQRALGVLQSIIDQDPGRSDYNVTPSCLNLYCFNAAISACEKGGAWVEALEIFEAMKDQSDHTLKPNIVTLSSLVLALDKAGQKELAQTKYEEGVRRNFVNPWRYTLDSRGEKVRAMDLHTFSAAMARAAIRSHMENLLERSAAKTELETPGDDLTIVVGKGLRSLNEPVLALAVRRVLQREYGVQATLDRNNTGRLVVKAAALHEFVAERNWR